MSRYAEEKLITNWNPVVTNRHGHIQICGVCEGRSITTSPVVEVREPDRVKTRSGSVYRLSDIDENLSPAKIVGRLAAKVAKRVTE